MQENRAESRTQLPGDAIIVGFCTLLGYGMATLYEIGYNSYFGIPILFISLDLTQILIGIASSVAVLAFFFMFWNFLFAIGLYEKDDAFSKELRTFLTLFIFLAVSLFLNPPQTLLLWAINIGAIAFFGLMQFAFPLLFYKGKTYREKLEAQRGADITISKRTVWNKLLGHTGPWPLIVFLFSILSINFSYSAGIYAARNQRIFDTVSTSPPTLILQKYGDYLLTREFNIDTHTLRGDLKIMRLEDLSNQGYTLIASTTGKMELSK